MVIASGITTYYMLLVRVKSCSARSNFWGQLAEPGYHTWLKNDLSPKERSPLGHHRRHHHRPRPRRSHRPRHLLGLRRLSTVIIVSNDQIISIGERKKWHPSKKLRMYFLSVSLSLSRRGISYSHSGYALAHFQSSASFIPMIHAERWLVALRI